MLVLRNLGIPALGFTTKSNTIARLHAKDEYHNVETFMKGIDIYTELIKNLGNLLPEGYYQNLDEAENIWFIVVILIYVNVNCKRPRIIYYFIKINYNFI